MQSSDDSRGALADVRETGSSRPNALSIYQILSQRAQIDPNAVAIGGLGFDWLTYGELLDLVDVTVEALSSLALTPKDRVAVVLPNGPEMATAFLSIACGASCAPLNPAYKDEEFDFYIGDLDARALVVSAGMDSPARDVALRRGLPIIELSGADTGKAGVFTLEGKSQSVGDAQSTSFPNDIALLLHTSGTTSRPKLVPLTHENVCQSGFNTAKTLNLTVDDRCLNVMPLFHIHGLIGAVLASITSGSSLVCAPGFDPELFFSWLDEFRPTWYTAVPTIHQAVLGLADANSQIIARRPLRLIRSSSAAMPVPVMQELERVFHTQVIEAYGMTEAAHQMASNPLSPMPRKPGSVGIAAGPEVAVMDAEGGILSKGEIGEVVIRGPNVTRGYVGNPEANAGAFTNGWFRTGDQGKLDSDGFLFLTGRLKEIINRGGEKVAPREVDEVLMQHSAVSQAVTFSVPHPTLGEDVAAAIVLKPNSNVSESELREFSARQLAAFKVPRQVLIVDEIPKGPTGKLQRIGLADKLSDLLSAQKQANFVSAKSSTEQEIAKLWRELLKVDQVGVQDDFNTLGGDSLSMTAMIIEVERRFRREVPIDSFLRSPTVQCLAGLIESESSADSAISKKGADVGSSGVVIKDSFFGGLKNRLFQLLALHAPGFKTTRVWLHRMRGVTIGENSSIGVSALIETAYPRLISVGDNVTIGMRAVIIGHLRDSTSESRRQDRPTVVIEDDVYIGPGAIVLPNVTIGRGSVVSAGSVVSRSIPPNILVQGNPARPIAHCGVSLGGGVSYEKFLRELKPIEDTDAA